MGVAFATNLTPRSAESRRCSPVEAGSGRFFELASKIFEDGLRCLQTIEIVISTFLDPWRTAGQKA